MGGEPCSIHLFIGDVPARPPYTFSDVTTQVGMVFNFVSRLPEDGEDGCANCVRQADAEAKSTDGIILTNALITRQKQKVLHSADPEDYLKSMAPEDVSVFLKKHFHWRVSTLDGREVRKGFDGNGQKVDTRIDDLGLKVAVAAGTARHYEDPAKLSKYSDYKILYEVTEDAISGTGAKPSDHLFLEE